VDIGPSDCSIGARLACIVDLGTEREMSDADPRNYRKISAETRVDVGRQREGNASLRELIEMHKDKESVDQVNPQDEVGR
jgi:hypothetical protein